MPDALNSGLIFLISTIFDLYLFVLVIRLLLAYSAFNYFNPIVQFVTRFSDPIIKPTRRFVPNIFRVESATLLWMVLVTMIKFFLVISLSTGMPNILGVLILSIGDTLKLILNAFFYAILLQAILSWIQPYSPINALLMQFTSPIMRPIQRVIPTVGGFDISPIPAMLLLQLLIILIASPIMAFGYTHALGY